MSADELSVKITARDELAGKIKLARDQLKRLTDESTELNKHISTPEGRRAWDQHAAAMAQTGRHLRSLQAEMGRVNRSIREMGDTGTREASRWRSSLDRVSGAMDHISRNVGPTINRGLKYATGGFLALAGAAGVMGVKTLGSLEQSEIAFGNLLGSQEKAKVLMDDLAKLASATPFELPQLTEASQKLLGYGFKLRDIEGTLTTIGDAAAGTGSGAMGIERIGTALGQMQAKSKISTEDINQLAEVGIPVWDILSKKMGLSKKAAMEFIATPGGAAKAFQQLNGVSGILDGLNGRYKGMMKDQSESLNGMLSTLKDTTQLGLADALRPYMGDIKNVIGGLTKGIGPALAGMADSAAKAAPTIRSVFGFLADNWRPIMMVAGAVVALYGAMRGVELVMRGVGAATFLLSNPIGWVILAIGALVAIVIVCYKRFEWFRKVVAFTWDWIQKATKAFVGWFAESAWPVIKKVIGWVVNYYKLLWNVAKFLWIGTVRVVGAFINWFRDAAWPVIKKVVGFVVGYYRLLWNVAKALWTGTIRVVKAFINWFSDSAWPTIKRVGAAIGKSWELVKEGAKVAWNAIKSAVLKPIELIQKAVEKLKSWLGGLFDGVASAAKTAADAVRGAWDGMTSWLPGRWMGGPVVAGSPYMVGELGPELFASRSGGLRLIGADGPEVRTFSESGTVIPHHLVPSITAVHRERVEHREVREGPLVTIGAINATGSVQDVEAAVRRAIAHASRLSRERR